MNEPQKKPLEKGMIDKISAAKDKMLQPHIVRETISLKTSSKSFPEMVDEAQKSVVRIVVHYGNGTLSWGSGFFISPNKIATCAHVLLGENIRDLADQFRIQQKSDFKKEFNAILATKTPRVEVELFNGIKLVGDSVEIDCGNDIGIIEVQGTYPALPYTLRDQLRLGDDVFFCGYQQIPYAQSCYELPFTVNMGHISSKYDLLVAGYKKRQHLQINAINLNGNSGGPLMLRSTGDVIGIINGNQIRHDIPLGIAYATSLDLAFAECDFLREAVVPRNASDT